MASAIKKKTTILATPVVPDPEEIRPQAETRSAYSCPEWRPSVAWLLLVLAAVFAWRILFSATVNLVPDECSYWAWSRRLDWSYFDNSGMTAYLIRLSTSVFGESTPLSVRFPFLILSVAGTYLVYRTGVILFRDGLIGLAAAVALNLTPMALLGGSAAMHDNALIFFWLGCLWAAAKFIRSEDPRWFYVMGTSAGCAILSKYTGVLVLASLLIFLMWSPGHRSALLRKEPWIGVGIAVILTFPIVLWNVMHDWASLHHILFIGTGSPNVWRRLSDGFGYHLAQFLLVSPLFYFAVITCAFAALVRNLLKPRPEQALLLSFALPIVPFGVMAFKGHVEANWASMAYPSAFLLAANMIFGGQAGDAKGIESNFGRRFMKWGVVVSVVPIVLVVVHAWVGLLPAFIERRLGKADRVIWETRGWDGLGKHVAGLVREGDVIAADSYQLCALLEFNVPGHPAIRYLAPWKRPTQFDVWEPSFDNLQGRNILFVSPVKLEPSSDALKTVYENFARAEQLPPYGVTYHGTEIRSIYVCRGIDFNPFAPIRLGPRSLFYRE